MGLLNSNGGKYIIGSFRSRKLSKLLQEEMFGTVPNLKKIGKTCDLLSTDSYIFYKSFEEPHKTCSGVQGRSFHDFGSGSFHDCHLDSSLFLLKLANSTTTIVR